MKTRRRIGIVLGAVVLAVLLGLVAAILALGPLAGIVVAVVVVEVAWTLYGRVVGPWHRTWGATEAEVRRELPGDHLVHEAAATTRAVTIDAPPAAVWPWLVQIGFGRAGWYSYDWIDNDGAPSADRVLEACQDLGVGDRIPMTPDLGFVVVALDPPTALVAISDDGSTSWCLHVDDAGNGSSRLVSRFRTHADDSFGALLWTAIADPGAFVMERRMLKGLRRRVEAAHRRAPVGPAPA